MRIKIKNTARYQENKTKSEDIDIRETNNDIFCYLHRKATINVHEYLRGLGVQGMYLCLTAMRLLKVQAKQKVK